MVAPRGTGWLARQQRAQAALAAREGGAHPVADNEANRIRHEAILAKEAADRAHAEEVARQRAVTVVRCPCCEGEGHVLLNRAAAMTEAFDRYSFVGWRPDAATIAKLLPFAFEIDGTGVRIAQTSVPSTAETTEPKKPTRRHVLPPHLDD